MSSSCCTPIFFYQKNLSYVLSISTRNFALRKVDCTRYNSVPRPGAKEYKICKILSWDEIQLKISFLFQWVVTQWIGGVQVIIGVTLNNVASLNIFWWDSNFDQCKYLIHVYEWFCTRALIWWHSNRVLLSAHIIWRPAHASLVQPVSLTTHLLER